MDNIHRMTTVERASTSVPSANICGKLVYIRFAIPLCWRAPTEVSSPRRPSAISAMRKTISSVFLPVVVSLFKESAFNKVCLGKR